ncbi:Phospholipid-transporting ATPase [Forsythia ovata]|uniref:Phospholipid-transporting ATPase n=1 Tax=Forsythia ovata TaxID=205694 RepID=A0ABD1WYR0_9LAMI
MSELLYVTPLATSMTSDFLTAYINQPHPQPKAIGDRISQWLLVQEGVPKVIESLQHAEIKVWVLTRNKQETAIYIGLSCKLLTVVMEHIIINGNSESECRKLLCDAKTKLSVKLANSSEIKNTESDYLENPRPRF